MQTIYLDNSATTQPFDEAIAAALRCMQETYFNPSSPYAPAIAAERALEGARGTLARALGDPDGTLVFTSGGTESNNLAIIGAYNAYAREGAHMVTTAIEHPSVAEPMRYLENRGMELSVVPTDSGGGIDPRAVAEAVRPQTLLVSVMFVNNETGAVQDVAEIGRLIKQRNPRALFHVDAVQGFMRLPLPEGLKDIDLLSVSGHKIHALKGAGALFLRRNTRIAGMQLGGGQEKGFRAGTENLPAIAALAAAAERFMREGESFSAHMRALKTCLAEGIVRRCGARINGPDAANGAPHILNASFQDVRAEVLVRALEGKGVLCGTGAACSSRSGKPSAVLTAMRLPDSCIISAVRFSLSPMTTEREIDLALAALEEYTAELSRFKRR